MEHVLIASLGESPIVVTAMYDLLTQKYDKHIDRLVVLYPQSEMVTEAYLLVEEVMKGVPCEVEFQDLHINDVNTTQDCLIFLQALYHRLLIHQNNGDIVYLSLAGGRKSMSALMAWAIPYFPCIKQLYHVLDTEERDFPKVEQLFSEMSENQRKQAMHPALKQLALVDIPLDQNLQIDYDLQTRLASMSVEELDNYLETNPAQAEAIEFEQTIAHGGKILEVWLTAHAAKQFEEMRQHNTERAKNFQDCFQLMRSAPMLRNRVRGIDKGDDDSFAEKSITFHFLKRMRKIERPLFYTTPRDIKNAPDERVDQVVVCELEYKRNGKYRSISEILSKSDFSTKPDSSTDQLAPVFERKDAETTLIVPLGTSPMVATQLYALLKRQGQAIHEVVLVYPTKQKIIIGAELVKRAFKEVDDVPCRLVRIPGLEDVASTADCKTYETALEQEIDRVREEHPNGQIFLALSGGRKGMAALAMFVAIRKRIPDVFHTLISTDDLEKQIVKETKVSVLSKPGLDKNIRNDRLFLRAYAKSDEEFARNFILFKIPVFLPPTEAKH
jgi:CRISPR-associated Csx14 family protein